MTTQRIELIRTRLTENLQPTQLEIIDEGYLHIGHAEEGAGHFAVERNKAKSGCETSYCGIKNVRQHRFAKADCSPRKAKTDYKQKQNRKMKSCSK